MNNIEQLEQLEQRVKEIVSQELETTSRNDVDDEGSNRYQIPQLGPSADLVQIINKINEIINEFNKSLIDNRI